MRHLIYKLGTSLFAFLSSLKLAVVVLLTLAAVLAVGTIIESLHDPETARYYVYGTIWFAALLCLLGLNVFFAALSRWPWKKHHIGFLITHLGIILILCGSMWTLLKGYEGQVIVAEGETAKRMTLKDPVLFFFDPQFNKLEEVPAVLRFHPPTPEEPFGAKVFEDVLVKVDQYLSNATHEKKVEAEGTRDNPALFVQLRGSRATLQEWVFSREQDQQRLNLGPASVSYLELPNVQWLEKLIRDPSKYPGPIVWVDGKHLLIPEGFGSQKNELVLAQMPQGEIWYAIRFHEKWSKPRRYVEQSELDTGWMDFKFSILKNLQKSQVHQIYKKVNVPKNAEGPPPAIHLVMANLAGTIDFWIGRGEERNILLGDRQFRVAYGLKSKPLDFELHLNDFKMDTYEGTQDPASFQSQVTLTDPERLEKSDYLISMNEPLKTKKYKIFQASYQLNPDGKDWSVLAISYDPGIAVKYLGSIVMVSGIITMFFLKPLFVQKKMAEKKLKKLEEEPGMKIPSSILNA